MIGKIPARIAKLATAMLATGAVLAWATASAGAMVTYTPIYNNLPSPLPGNVPSEAMEATSSSEFGGEVELAGATADHTKVTVAMSSWACQSGGATDDTCVSAAKAKFEWPVTLHIYTAGPGDSVGTQIVSLTKTFKMPYRPSASPQCAGNGGWHLGVEQANRRRHVADLRCDAREPNGLSGATGTSIRAGLPTG